MTLQKGTLQSAFESFFRTQKLQNPQKIMSNNANDSGDSQQSGDQTFKTLDIKAVVLFPDELNDFSDPAILKAVNDAGMVYRVHSDEEQLFVPIHPKTREDLVNEDTGEVLISRKDYESDSQHVGTVDYDDLSVDHIRELVSVSEMHRFWREFLRRSERDEEDI